MDGAVPVVVVANRTVENVIAQNAVKRLALRCAGYLRFRQDLHPCAHGGRACSHELSVDLYHARITRLDRTQLRVIADLRNLHPHPINDIDQAFTARRFLNYTIDCYCYHRSPPGVAA
jgi:hypothetical protein